MGAGWTRCSRRARDLGRTRASGGPQTWPHMVRPWARQAPPALAQGGLRTQRGRTALAAAAPRSYQERVALEWARRIMGGSAERPGPRGTTACGERPGTADATGSGPATGPTTEYRFQFEAKCHTSSHRGGQRLDDGDSILTRNLHASRCPRGQTTRTTTTTTPSVGGRRCPAHPGGGSPRQKTTAPRTKEPPRPLQSQQRRRLGTSRSTGPARCPGTARQESREFHLAEP